MTTSASPAPIFIIEDDEIMAECIAQACAPQPTQTFSNAIEAMDVLAAGPLPLLIFLDILLDGPDGFAFLNELVSYDDTAKIPIVIVTSLNLRPAKLKHYGVVGILDKTTMTPEEIAAYAQRFAH